MRVLTLRAMGGRSASIGVLFALLGVGAQAWAQAPIPEDPLDPETLALIEALTSTPTETAPKPPPPPHHKDDLLGTTLQRPVARSVDGAVSDLPVGRSTLRSSLAPYRWLDDLRVEPSLVDLGRLDPALYQVRLQRKPDALSTSRLWLSELSVLGLAMPAQGWATHAQLEGRSADRSGGAVASLGYAGSAMSFRATVRGDAADQLARTATTAVVEAGSSLGASLRLQLGSGPWISSLGYDADTNGSDVHLAQAFLRYRGEQLRFRVGGGWINAQQRSALQARTELGWGSEGVDLVGGAFAWSELEGARARVEAYGRMQLQRSWLVTSASARVAQAIASGPDPALGLGLEARVEAKTWSALWWRLRYARSFEALETLGREEVDLVSTGPELRLGHTQVSIDGWIASARTDFDEDRTELWGIDLRAALHLSPWTLSTVFTRAEGLAPEPALRMEAAASWALPQVDGYIEAGLQLALENTIYLDDGRKPPRERLVLRAGGHITPWLLLRAAVTNLTDAPFRAFPGRFVPDIDSGLEVRTALVVKTL